MLEVLEFVAVDDDGVVVVVVVVDNGVIEMP
jgi:hypothetical protein